jgi:hypothetical protein
MPRTVTDYMRAELQRPKTTYAGGSVTQQQCPKCKRLVTVADGKLCTHGPGPKGEFVCPGSGDKGMVKAARHLKA